MLFKCWALPPKSLDLKFGSSILRLRCLGSVCPVLIDIMPCSMSTYLSLNVLDRCFFLVFFFSSKDTRLKRQLLGPSSSYKYYCFDFSTPLSTQMSAKYKISINSVKVTQKWICVSWTGQSTCDTVAGTHPFVLQVGYKFHLNRT